MTTTIANTTPRVAIAGAGLAGLCLAQNLLRAGFDPHVYERDTSPFARKQGYRITVDRDGTAALRQSLPKDLFDLAIATAGEPGGSFRFTNEKLRDAFRLNFDASDGGRQMDRQILRSILMQGLEDRIHYGARAVGVRRISNEELELRFADAKPVQARLVVGADGIGSALRPQIMPGADPKDTGMAGIYGRTPLRSQGTSVIPAVLEKSGVLAIGRQPKCAFFFTAMRFATTPAEAFARAARGSLPPIAGDDYVMWGLVLDRSAIPLLDRSDSRGLNRLAAELAVGYHPLIRSLIDTADPDATLLSSFFVGQRPRDWPMRGATMMGDAVHAMPPFGAHGGNTALRDAALLGRHLSEAHTEKRELESGITAYQDEMLPYAFESVDSAARMMRRMTESSGLQKWVMQRLLPGLHRITVPIPRTMS